MCIVLNQSGKGPNDRCGHGCGKFGEQDMISRCLSIYLKIGCMRFVIRKQKSKI